MAARKKTKGKISGLKADGKPNAYWRRFKERLDNYADIPVKDWNEEHVLGHILKRYKDQVGMEFSLSYSGPPSKCKEIYCVRRMINFLGAEDGETLKKYIDWVFDTIIIPSNTTISSIAYFFTTNFVLKFKQQMRSESKITRTKKLPENIINLAVGLELDVETYGDLAFAKVAIENDPKNEDLEVYFRLFTELKEIGFDETVLNSLEG